MIVALRAAVVSPIGFVLPCAEASSIPGLRSFRGAMTGLIPILDNQILVTVASSTSGHICNIN